MQPWAMMAEDITETFKKWELINKKFLDSVQDLIKLWKEDDVLHLVEWFFGHYWWGKRTSVELLWKLIDLWYLDMANKVDKNYFKDPQLLESVMFYLDEKGKIMDKELVKQIKKIFNLQ